MSTAVPNSCADCLYFNGSPLDVEAAFPGLASLSSGYAAVRAADGLCAMHDRYVAATSRCALIAAPPAPNNHRTSAHAPYR
jgi:hypothetical protein